MTKKLGKSHSKVFFRNILPTTFIDKNTGYYKYGYNDNLPLDIIQAINNSGTAKKALKKYATTYKPMDLLHHKHLHLR